jgi:chemotaxis protein methyltransferase CheR
MAARERPRLAARTAGWSDPAFGVVAEVVHVVAGLVFPPNRQPSAESGMRRAMTALRIRDPAALANAIRSPGDARDMVLAELTVGETYFFREPLQLGLLETRILPALASRRDPDAPLRIWSAGCASGEEPYTIAIMLREAGWSGPARILGTDVAQPRLDAARRAHYTRWSLRGAAPERVGRWFESRASHFLLRPEIRDSVEFAQLNLVADEYPSPATGTLDQDVVLCRNVLIYFDMESVARIATRLLASLAPDGWLLLGASDPPLSGLVPCEVMMTPGGVVYRRADRLPASARPSLAVPTTVTAWDRGAWATAPAAVPALVPDPVSATPVGAPIDVPAAPPLPPRAVPAGESVRDEVRAAYAASDYARAESLARSAVAQHPDDLPAWVLLVRVLANEGRLREADEACVRALDLHRLSPELHVLHAMLLGAAQQPREAMNAARRALYLDRTFIMAHLQLGDAMSQLGDRDAAERAFRNALGGLAQLPPDADVPGADGVPAARLRQVAESRLRSLRDGANR